jgi:dTDP-4-dehydrorhamnose reductase
MAQRRLKILVLGSKGRLGSSLLGSLASKHDVIGFGRHDLNLLWDPERIKTSLREVSFDVLINAAGDTSVDHSETREKDSLAANAVGPEAAAQVCQDRGAKMYQISTDYVFGGDGDAPLSEEDPTHPVQVYGTTKLTGERKVLAACPSALVTRISWLFGGNKNSFPDRILEMALSDTAVSAVADKWSSPTSVEDLVGWLTFLIEERPLAEGHIHLCNSGSCCWQEYGQYALDVAAELGLPLKSLNVEPIGLKDVTNFVAARPRYTVLNTHRFQETTGIIPRHWRQALRDYILTRYSKEG